MPSKHIKTWCISCASPMKMIVSLMLAFFGCAATKTAFGGSITAGLAQNHIESFVFPADLCIFILVFVFIFLGLCLVGSRVSMLSYAFVCPGQRKIHFRRTWLLCTCVIITSWIPWIIAYAPGSVLVDSLASIGQGVSGAYTNHHPLMYTLLVSVFYRVGLFLGNVNLGILMYAVVQSVALASVTGYVVAFLYREGLRVGWLVLMLAWYCVMPFFPAYGIILWKDLLFSCALAVLSLRLLAIARDSSLLSSRAGIASLCVLCVFVMFLRNNGMLIVLCVMGFLFVAFRKVARHALIALGLCVAVTLLIQGPLYRSVGVTSPAVEAVGIPLQQIAYVVSTGEDELSVEQAEFVESLLPLETWWGAYAPCIVDTIKWHPSFNTDYLENHGLTLLMVWIQLVISNPIRCMDAYLLSTLGFWHPWLQNAYGYVDTYISNNDYGISYMNLFGVDTTEDLRQALGAFRPQIGSGTLLWVALLSFALIWDMRRREALFYCPGLLCWLTIMIATPVAFSLRYVYVFALLLPLFVVLPFFQPLQDGQIEAA